jgi:intracellular multiplication protein IcmV
MKNKKSDSRIIRVLSSLINVRAWFDWERLKSFTRYLVNGVKKFFVPQKTTDTETFEAAKKRLNLTDKDLLARQKGLLRVSLLMAFFAILLFIYSMYHFYYFNIKGGVLSLVVMLIAGVLAFRYNFWYFQIKERKLGCSIREWYKKSFTGDKR